MVRKTFVACAVAAALGPGLAAAQQPAAPASPHTITGNVGLYSQYIFRGLTQTNGDPAIQGGFDYSHASGFYAGTWASNISWLKENFSAPPPGAIAGTYGEGASMEWDFYGGYKWGFAPDWTLDLGTLYYWYPGKLSAAAQAAVLPPAQIVRADTWEVYAGLSWKWLSAKLSYSIMDKTFGVDDSQGTTYLDISANIPLGDFAKEMTGVTLMAHWGWQKFRGTDLRNAVIPGTAAIRSNDDVASYYDLKLGASYALPKDFTIGAFWSKAYSADTCGYGSIAQAGLGCFGPYPKEIGKSTGTIYVQKTF